MTREEVLQDKDVKRFLAETSDAERARLASLVADLQLVAAAHGIGRDRPTINRMSKPLDDRLAAALERIAKEGPFLQTLLNRLGERGFQTVAASELMDQNARNQAPNVALKFPSLVSDLNDKIAGLASSGTIFMGCGQAAAMMGAGVTMAIVAAASEGPAGMVGVFVGGALFGAGAVGAMESC